jgi:putative ABC transport system substrate-binding protein
MLNQQKARTIGFALGALFFSLSEFVEAQTAKIPRVGFLSAFSSAANPDRVEAFRRGLAELGYSDGRNVTIEYRWGDGKFDRLPGLAADLLEAANQIGLTIPPSVLTHADRLIK